MPRIVEEIVHAPGIHQEQEIPDHQTWQMVQEVPQFVHEPVEQIAEQVVYVPKITPQGCVVHESVELVVEQVVHGPKIIPQKVYFSPHRRTGC